jgi:single-stranded-DNA-specific exonuclease
MSEWKIRDRVNEKNLVLDIHPVALQILFQRGINTPGKVESFLHPDYDRDIHDSFLFPDMEKIVDRVNLAVKKGEKVLVYGDYDADGITASVILKETLENLGISSQVYIPDKKTEGYGLNEAAIRKFKKEKISLILTVDCGITNTEEIKLANSLGIDVIIIDHHHIPATLPRAFAIINARMEKTGYPFRELSGVGASFKVVQALFKKFLPQNCEQLKWILDLVAIGTVADCVPLTGENRVLVKYGLLVLSKTRRVGLQELFAVGRIQIDENNFPDAKKISFQVAPRINAAGRMDHANLAFDLIIEKDRVRARNLALEIEDSNQRRQRETDRITEEVRILANTRFKDKKFIFAAEEHYPIGIAGLVAGKIADEFRKPTAVFQKEEGVSRGSFRSIPEINIIGLLEKCGPYLLKCGGHNQAAGVTVANEKAGDFFKHLGDLIEKELEGKKCLPEIEIDAELAITDVDFELAQAIAGFAPFGEGNKDPVFLMKNLVIVELRTVGNGDRHIKLFLRAPDSSPKMFEAIGFNLNEKFNYLKNGDVIDVVFNLEIDSWNGNKKIQLKLIDLKISK